ncbi:hypothetical protein L291_2355 [Acinetobacter guillouiae MSP4-18]|nr:hypothetical protein L291_2355 [Acinetobacter guillouiae MSP4-18]
MHYWFINHQHILTHFILYSLNQHVDHKTVKAQKNQSEDWFLK